MLFAAALPAFPTALLVALVTCIVTYTLGARELYEACPKASTLLRPRAVAAYGVTLAAAALAALYSTADDPVQLWLLAGLVGLLVTIGWLDLATGMLSDALTGLLGGLAIVYNTQRFVTVDDWLPTLALALGLFLLGWFFAGPYSRWRGRDMLGWGDVKFFAAAGFWLLPLQLPVFLIIAGGVGALAAAGYKTITGKCETPFAPALCVALYLCVAFGLDLNQMLDATLNLSNLSVGADGVPSPVGRGLG